MGPIQLAEIFFYGIATGANFPHLAAKSVLTGIYHSRTVTNRYKIYCEATIAKKRAL